VRRKLGGPLIAVPNVTAHPSTASVPVTVLLYNDLLLCGFNVAIKMLTYLNVVTFILGGVHLLTAHIFSL